MNIRLFIMDYSIVKNEILLFSLILLGGISQAQHAETGITSAAAAIEQTIMNSGQDAAARQFREMRSEAAGKYSIDENEFNNLGHRLIRKGRFGEAALVFSMNVASFPGSANTYSSLSEGYLYLGNRGMAEEVLRNALAGEQADTNFIKLVEGYLNDLDLTGWMIGAETKEPSRFRRGEQTGLKGLYLGQEPPGDVPEIFAPGVVSTVGTNDFCASFSVDGSEFYFNRGMTIMVCRLTAEGWTAPEPASFNGKFRNHEPHLAFDGKRMFFGSSRPPQAYGIWLTERTGSGWAEPVRMWDGMHTSSAENGNIYLGSEDPFPAHINRTGLSYGKYLAPVTEDIKLVDTDGKVIDIFHPAIAPDEQYLVFDDNRQLYACFKESGGSWGKPVPLSEEIRQRTAGIPYITPDGKYLFFNSHSDLLWVSTGILEKYRQTINQ